MASDECKAKISLLLKLRDILQNSSLSPHNRTVLQSVMDDIIASLSEECRNLWNVS